MRVIVTGGRTLFNVPFVCEGLRGFPHKITELIHGDAEGLDRTAAWIAASWGIEVTGVPADWSNVLIPGAVIKYRRGTAYNALAGHWRNQRMIDLYKPEYGIVFPGGTGTADMKQRLELARIPIYEIASI